MKRSEINRILRSADEFIQQRGFYLPPFAYWTPAEWKTKGEEVREIVDNRLGWDITDFGSGDFDRVGLFLFTLRNGNPEDWRTLKGKLYAEKILIVEAGQVTPMHFHWNKTEDIINRGGGRLAIQVYCSTASEGLDPRADVRLSTDGVRRVLPAGSVLVLNPGESVTLTPGLYHKFWGMDSRVLVGEVSMVNDDEQDNRFNDPAGRFPQLEEDEDPLYLLCTDYLRYYRVEPQATG
jgi:D-lyxose ketol-isomerase